MLRRRELLIAIFLLGLPLIRFAGADEPESIWENDIRAFEKKDRENPPPLGEILFVGSSSIRFWKTAEAFPDLKTINRGFGGSQTADVVRYADRIVLPYKPKTIVFYSGDNDIASGKTPEQVLADFGAFMKIVREALPQTRVIHMAIKPSIARWKLVDKMREANSLIRERFKDDPLFTQLDTEKLMLGPDGMPRKELLMPDGLHLNAEGYKIWNEQLRPLLTAPAKQP